ncbi:hypothetical protein [Nitratireductor aquibiodomus]|uniref:hypothetical protein n=1 Tax=Nitratireductor aquibiodomus TaxID=204799 RepID=UPI00046AC988|nr:hypothetical protein [Nitratireductor aquibiodomus]
MPCSLRNAPPSPEEITRNKLFGQRASWRGVTVASDKSVISVSFTMDDGSVQRLRLTIADAGQMAQALQDLCDPNFDPRSLHEGLSLRQITEVEEAGDSGTRRSSSTRTEIRPVNEQDAPAFPSPRQNADN